MHQNKWSIYRTNGIIEFVRKIALCTNLFEVFLKQKTMVVYLHYKPNLPFAIIFLLIKGIRWRSLESRKPIEVAECQLSIRLHVSIVAINPVLQIACWFSGFIFRFRVLRESRVTLVQLRAVPSPPRGLSLQRWRRLSSLFSLLLSKTPLEMIAHLLDSHSIVTV